MHMSSKELRLHKLGGFLVFLFFFSIDSKGKKAPNLSQIFKTSVENVLGKLLDCKMRCPAGRHE